MRTYAASPLFVMFEQENAMTSEAEQELKGPRSVDVWSRRDGTTVTIDERGRRTVVVADKAKTVIVASDATDVAR
jgi:hypothetical protein